MRKCTISWASFSWVLLKCCLIIWIALVSASPKVLQKVNVQVSHAAELRQANFTKPAEAAQIIVVDADPGQQAFSADDIEGIKDGGKNKVLSYFNLGTCERWRSYWNEVPAGFKSCVANKSAQQGTSVAYPDEVWMDVSNEDFQHLLLDYIAPRLVAQGVDGFYFDAMEIIEHGAAKANGPCNEDCNSRGLNLIKKLREKYPDLLFVMHTPESMVAVRQVL